MVSPAGDCTILQADVSACPFASGAGNDIYLSYGSYAGQCLPAKTQTVNRLQVIKAPYLAGGIPLEGKFYFSRRLIDGSPQVAPDDKELRFETRIGNRKVRVKFSLKKLTYQNRLQL